MFGEFLRRARGHVDAKVGETDIQIKPEMNVWRELAFSNWSFFGFLNNAQLPVMFNPVGLAMLIPGLLDN